MKVVLCALLALLGAACRDCVSRCNGLTPAEDCFALCKCTRELTPMHAAAKEEEKECDEECKAMCQLLGSGWALSGCMKYCGCGDKAPHQSEYDISEDEEVEDDQEGEEEHDSETLKGYEIFSEQQGVSGQECRFYCAEQCIGKLGACMEECTAASCGSFQSPLASVGSGGLAATAFVTSFVVLVYLVTFRRQSRPVSGSKYSLLA